MTLMDEYYENRDSWPGDGPRRALLEIVADLRGRRGLRQVWDEIDSDIQEEILQEWLAIIERSV